MKLRLRRRHIWKTILKVRFISGTENSRKRKWEKAIIWTVIWFQKSELILFDFEFWFAICLYFLKIHCWVSCSVSHIGHIDCHATRSTMLNCSLRQAKIGECMAIKIGFSKKVKTWLWRKGFRRYYERLVINSLKLPFVCICLFVVSGVYF